MENNIQSIITYLSEMNGESVHITTTHKLFGIQNIECALSLIYDKERIGFRVKEQEIYININDICNATLGCGWCQFEDDLMQVKIYNINYKKIIHTHLTK